jgi:hypothetical protein
MAATEIRCVVGDTTPVPLNALENDGVTPILFASGDVVYLEVVNEAGASLKVWKSSVGTEIVLTLGTNLMTLNVAAADLNSFSINKPYSFGVRRKNSSGQLRTLLEEGDFTAVKGNNPTAIP